MKNNRILSTAGICPKNATKLRSYCNLMQSSLTDKWLFADEFIQSHVCFIRDDYLKNIKKEQINNSQVMVVVDVNKEASSEYKYSITAPLTASKIRNLLNQISANERFIDIRKKQIKASSTISKFKSAFSRIRKNFLGSSGLKLAKEKADRRSKFITKITRNINLDELPASKLVFIGSPSSGKTTAINAASLGSALSSDVSATDSVANDKSKTTVGIDFAEVRTSNGDKLKLFGTPGQIKYNFVWDVVGKNADAFLVLLDMSRPEPLSYLKFYLRFLKTELGKLDNVFCALTHCEENNAYIGSFIECIETEYPMLRGIYHIDAREYEDISIVLDDINTYIKKNNINSTVLNKPILSMVKQG